MAESATITCRICLGKIKQEHDLMLNPKLEFPSQEVVSITENSVACTKCKVEINETHTLDTQPHLIKKEIKEELVEDEGRSLCIDECTLYCYQCNYGSNDKQILTDHIFTHRLKCNQCNYTSPDTSMFMTHQQIHFRNYAWIKTEEHVSTHTESPRQVPQISNELLECGNNKIHMKAYAQMTMLESIKKPFKCSLCNYQNKDSKLYKIHKLKHYGEHSFCCDKCDYKTYFKPYLMSHKLVHSDETPFKCNFCDFSSKRLGNLKIHKIIHSGDRPYKCNLCDFTTKRSSNLKVHLNKHSDQRNFCCDQCDHKTNTKDKLTKHKKVHSEDKLFKCNLCTFTSKYLSNFKTHLNKHSSERNFVCDKCDYKTYTKSLLLSHRRVHSQEKPFKCSLCDFTSKRSGDLRFHLKKHSRELPLATNTKRKLANHKIVHSEETAASVT